MLISFPSRRVILEALRLELVPPAARTAAARAVSDEAGRVWIETTARLSRRSTNEMRRLGVLVNPAGNPKPTRIINDWLQLLPLERDGADVPSSVVFSFAEGRSLVRLVAEMQRIGHALQSFCWLNDDTGLLLVNHPPLFSLLRAEQTDASAPLVYAQQRPGVWVRYGYHQPLAELIEPTSGEWLFIDPPSQWRQLVEPAFHSTRSIREFFVVGSNHWRDDPASVKQIPIQWTLRPNRRGEPARLWLFSEQPLAQLEMMVGELNEQQLDQIDVTLIQSSGREMAVLRGAGRGGDGPAVIASAEPFAVVQQFPNLFAPAAMILGPPVRRDVLRELWAANPDTLTWLEPTEEGVRANEWSAAAFRPLSSIVEHVTEHSTVRIQPLPLSPPFDLEPFDVRQESQVKKGNARIKSETTEIPSAKPPEMIVRKGVVPQRPTEEVKIDEPVPELPTLPDAELRERLADRQRQFLSIAGPPDDSARLALLSELADLHAATDFIADAAWCWLNLLWFTDTSPTEMVRRWLQGEQRGRGGLLDAKVLGSILADPAPLGDSVRFVAAHVIATFHLPAPSILRDRISEISAYLERYESLLPVRAAWLAWLAVSRLTGGDLLALARARDRLQARMLEGGLRRELDVPMFLRGSEGADNEDNRRQLRVLYRKARNWSGGDPNIIDLTFAFGFARLDDSAAWPELLEAVTDRISPEAKASRWLLAAYRHRIEEAHRREPIRGLPPHLLHELATMPPEVSRPINLRRRASRILEPFEHIDPFHDYRDHRYDQLGRELAALVEVAEKEVLAFHLGQLRRRETSNSSRFRVVAAALTYGPRLGDGFTGDILADLRSLFPYLSSMPDLFTVVQTLEKALLLAAHIGSDELIPPIVIQLKSLLDGLRGERLAWVLAQLQGHLIRTLARVGMRDEIRTFAEHLTNGLLDGRKWKRFLLAKAVNWGVLLRGLVQLVGAWFYLDEAESAKQILDLVHAKLVERTLRDEEQANLAVAYAVALGETPPEFAWPRIHDLFDRLGELDVSGANVPLHQCEMRTIEAAVLSVAGEEFTASALLRRWIDEDEYLIRKRIHADFAAVNR